MTGIAQNVLALPPLVISHLHHVIDGVSKSMFMRFRGSESSFGQKRQSFPSMVRRRDFSNSECICLLVIRMQNISNICLIYYVVCIHN
jgi:hypothetical protein